MTTSRQKFATQADPVLLAQVKEIAQKEGRQLQAVIEEALQEYVQKKTGQTPRPLVMKHFSASLQQYDALYQRLAQ